MKWLKTYKLYLEQDENEPSVVETDSNVSTEAKEKNLEALDNLRKEILDFKTNKTKIEAIFKQKEKDNENKINLDQELQVKIYQNKKFPNERNRFLKMYEQQLKTKLMIVNIEKQVEKDKTTITEQQNILNDNKTRQNEVDNDDIMKELKEQEKNINDQIKKLKANITLNNSKLSKLKIQKLKEDEKNFKEFLDKEERRLLEMQNLTK